MKRKTPFTAVIMALLPCLLLVAACEEESTPVPPSPTASVEKVDTAAPSPSALPSATLLPPPPSPAPTFTPVATATPSPSAIPEPPAAALGPGVDLGLPGGDCFQVQALVSDRGRDWIYALCAHTDQGPADAVVLIDVSSGERLAYTHLGGTGAADGGQLALDPEAGSLYVLSRDLGALVVLDADTLLRIGQLRGVQRVLAAPGSGRFYVLSEEGDLVAYSAADLSELGRLPIAELSPSAPDHALHYNPASDHLYAVPLLSGAGHTAIQVRDGGDLQLEDEVVVPGSVKGLAVDGDANRFFVATDEQLIAVDGESLNQVERALEPVAAEGTVSDLGVDGATGRLHLFGSTFLGPGFWLVIDADSLETLYEYEDTPGWATRTLDGEGNLLTRGRGGEVVSRVDPETGQPLAGEAGRLVLGVRLLAVLPHPDDDRLYVVDSSGALRVLDGPTLRMVESRPALLQSGLMGLTRGDEVALALDTKANRLYVADVPTNETVVLDLDTLEPVGTVGAAGDLAVDAEGGRLFIAYNNVYLFDTDTFLPVGGAEGEPAISYEPEPGQPLVPYLWAEEVIFDTNARRLLVRADVGGSVHVGSAHYGVYEGDTLASLGSLSVDQPNDYLWTPVLLPESDRILLAYTSGGRCRTGQGPLTWDCRQGLVFFGDDLVELGQIRGLSGRFLTDQDGHPGEDGYLYLWRGSHLLALDLERGYPLTELALEGEIWDMVLGAGQGQIYYWAWDRLAALPTAELLERVPLGQADPPALEGPDFVYPSPNFEEDDTLFAAIPATGLYRSTDGGETWQFASRGLQNYYLGSVLFSPDYESDGTLFVEVNWPRTYRSSDGGQSWLPDGPPRLAFVSDRTGNKEIYAAYYDPEIALLGSEPQRLTDDPAQDDNPAWSPHGARLVFQSDRSGNNDLWIMNWDGSGLSQLTSDPADDLLPAWSPDGEQIAFVSLRDGNPEIYLMSAPEPGGEGDESTVRRLTNHPAGDWRPAWSPDGTQIAFASTRDGDNEIYVMEVDGAEPGSGGVQQITDNEADDRDPAWMQGGEERIYFVSDREGNLNIYSVQPGGEGVKQITDTPYDENHVTVGSSAGELLYVTDQTGDADIYHWQREPYIRRLTVDSADDTAPAWNPWVLVAPQALRPTPSPTATPTPRPPTTTPAATRAATPAAPASTPGLPVLAGTPLPTPLPFISPENADSVIEMGHWGGGDMTQIAYAPDGRLVAVAAEDGIYLYDGQTLEAVHYTRKDVPVEYLAFSPDGQTLASDWGTAVRLWDVGGCGKGSPACGTVAGTLEGHSERVSYLAFSPDGETLASGSLDETVRLWRVSDGSPLFTLEMPEDRPGSLSWVKSLAFSPDGETLAVGLFDDTIRLWRLADGQLLHTLEEQGYWVTILAFSPDGALLVSCSEEGTVRLWRVDDGQLLQTLEDHGRPVLSLVFQDAETLLTTTDDNIVRYWDVGGCASQAAGCGTLLRTLEESEHSASAVAFGPDRERWVSFNWTNLLRMWRTSDGQTMEVSLGYTGWINNVAFHPDGTLLVAVAYDDLFLWRVPESRLLDIVQGHEDRITSLAFSPDGATLATASEDETVRLWQVEDWKVQHTLDDHSGDVLDVAFSPDSKTLASSGWDGTIRLWRVRDGLLLHTLDGGGEQVPSVAISPDGSMLASGSDDGSVRLWAMDSCADPSGQCGRLLQTLTGHSVAVLSLAFSPDGGTLASGSEDSTVRLWAVGECPQQGDGCGRRLQTLTGHEGRVGDVVFARDGRLLVTSSSDGRLRLWDVSQCADGPAPSAGEGCGRLLDTLEGGTANSVAISPDGTLLASDGSWVVQMWGATAPGKGPGEGTATPDASPTATPLPPTLTPSPTPVVPQALRSPLAVISPQNAGQLTSLDERVVDHMWWLAYSLDGRLLAVATTDGIYLYDAQTQAELQFIRTKNPVPGVAFSPDGKLLASSQLRRDVIEIWDVGDCLNGSGNCGRRLATLVGPEGEDAGQTGSLAFGPEGWLLASKAPDDMVRLWDVSACANGAEGSVQNAGEGCGRLLHTLEGHTSIVYEVAFSPDGTLLASTSNDLTVRLWDVGGCASGVEGCGRPLGVLEGHVDSVDGVAFSPDGTMVASGSGDSLVRLWDVADCATEGEACGDLLQTLEGHTSSVESLGFSPDSRLLASGGWDGSLRLWDVEACASGADGCGRLLHTLEGPSTIESLAFRPDGKVLASAEDRLEGDLLRLWGVAGE